MAKVTYLVIWQEYLDRFVFGTEQVPGAKFQRSGGRLFQDFQVRKSTDCLNME